MPPPGNEHPPRYPLFSSDTLDGLAAAEADAAASGSDEFKRACELARAAVNATDAGRTDEARASIERCLGLTADPRLLFLAFQFYVRTSDLDAALSVAEQRTSLAPPESTELARACTNRGLVHFLQGDMGRAEAWHRRAIEIDRRLGNDEGVARALGNLGLIPESRGDLGEAARIFGEALAIAERAGATRIIGTMCANLGDVALARNRRDEAGAFWTRGVAVFAELGIDKHRDEYAAKLQALGTPEDRTSMPHAAGGLSKPPPGVNP